MSEKLKIFCGECRQKLDVTDLAAFELFNCPRCGAEMRVPARFGRYLLERVIGDEKKYLYYRASDTVLERRLTFCELKKKFFHPEEKQTMMRSGKILALFNHPCILPIYDQREEKNHFYRTTKAMDGGRLDWLFKEKMLPPPGILLGILADIGDALIELRRANVVHHLITPAGMFLDRNGKVRLGNFEFAEKIDDPNLALSGNAKAAFKSFTYSSPEWLSQKSESFSGDAYSYALSSYHLITGQLPFLETSDPKRMREEREKCQIPPLSKRRGIVKVDTALSNQILQLLSPKPENRGEIDALVQNFRTLSIKLGCKAPFRAHFP